MLERHSDEISTAEAVRLIKLVSPKMSTQELSVEKLAEFLKVPEDQLVEKVEELRHPPRPRVFVDSSGIVSGAIAAVAVCFLICFFAIVFLKARQPVYSIDAAAVRVDQPAEVVETGAAPTTSDLPPPPAEVETGATPATPAG